MNMVWKLDNETILKIESDLAFWNKWCKLAILCAKCKVYFCSFGSKLLAIFFIDKDVLHLSWILSWYVYDMVDFQGGVEF